MRIRLGVCCVAAWLVGGVAAHAQTRESGVVGETRSEAARERRKGNRLSIGGVAMDLALPAALLRVRDREIPEAVPEQFVFTTQGDAAAIAAAAGVTLLETAPLQSLGTQLAVVAVRRGDDAAAAQARLAAQPGVEGLQPNLLAQTLAAAPTAPTTTALPKRFRLHGVDTAAALPASGTIAMIDTAIALEHPALQGARIEQTRIVEAAPPAAHSTALAGLIVGTSEEVPGAARGARLVNLAAFTERKNGIAVANTADLAKAFDAAAMLRPEVLSLAFGGKHDPLLARLLDEIQRRGVCVAAAAGNGGAGAAVPFPARHAASVAVTAVDEALKPYAFATRGARIDVAAVGVDVFVPVPGGKRGGYRRMSGSSIATAFVAGNLLRMPECNGGRTPTAMRAKVQASAQDLGAVGPDPIFGAGLFRLP